MAKREEKTWVPPERFKPVEARYCLVLDDMSTPEGTRHREGDVIQYTGACDSLTIREMTDKEIEEHLGFKAAKEAPPPPPQPGSPDDMREKARGTIILSALGRLDHEDPSAWTDSGKPNIAAVMRELMKVGASNTDTSRAEIQKFAPKFRRSAGNPPNRIEIPTENEED